MALDSKIKEQLKQHLANISKNIEIYVNAVDDETSLKMIDLLNEIKELSPHISLKKSELPKLPSFSINRPGDNTGIVFAGIPMGHEFTSLILAILQVGGYPLKISNDLIDQIKKIEGHFDFETFISLSCHNCPDVVQALNLLALLNPNISHTMIDGALFQDEVSSKNIMSVPTICLMAKNLAKEEWN